MRLEPQLSLQSNSDLISKAIVLLGFSNNIQKTDHYSSKTCKSVKMNFESVPVIDYRCTHFRYIFLSGHFILYNASELSIFTNRNINGVGSVSREGFEIRRIRESK